jgi:hypothetical protein
MKNRSWYQNKTIAYLATKTSSYDKNLFCVKAALCKINRNKIRRCDGNSV